MNLLDLAALALAGGSLTDLWFNASLVERLRQRFKDNKLLGCDYCMNWEAALWLALLSYLPSLWLPPPWNVAIKLPVYWLAAAYAAWLVNEVRAGTDRDYMRTVRVEDAAREYGAPAAETKKVVRAYKDLTITFGGGIIRHYCSAECWDAAARETAGQGETYDKGMDWRGVETHCARCLGPLPGKD